MHINRNLRDYSVCNFKTKGAKFQGILLTHLWVNILFIVLSDFSTIAGSYGRILCLKDKRDKVSGNVAEILFNDSERLSLNNLIKILGTIMWYLRHMQCEAGA